MNILVAGTFKYPMYQEALCHGIELNGHKVIRLLLGEDRPYNLSLCTRNANKLEYAVANYKPDAIFLYRVENIWSGCLKKIKRRYPDIPIAIYHNDDPFRKGWKRYIKSIHYLNCVRHSDITYVYRKVNIDEAYARGAKWAKLYMSHYNSQTDLKNLADFEFEKQTDEVAFIGHYEADYRIDVIDYLFKNNVNLHIYGMDWANTFNEQGWPKDNLHPGASGDDYRELVKKVGIALAFFSEKNRDEYTRRCFEIPIMGTLIAAPLTAVTKELYQDRENALLFKTKEELLDKIQYYNNHIDERNRIARTGYYNIKDGDYSEIARASMVLKDYIAIKERRRYEK